MTSPDPLALRTPQVLNGALDDVRIWGRALTVRAAGGGYAPSALSYVNRLCTRFLYGRAGCLSTENAGFRPGQEDQFTYTPGVGGVPCQPADTAVHLAPGGTVILAEIDSYASKIAVQIPKD